MIGKTLAHYRLTGALGEGGMGVVYRALDTKLDREVAIKVLPPAFAEDPERLARIEREAKVLAQLHHPNIASIFGLEDADGVPALVMELVEGPTLADRLATGPIALDDALAIARQIAEALEEAHEKGIVHRDLKPANIKVSVDGRVKVLDFGLAKALDTTASKSGGDAARSPTLMNSPTLTSAGTQLGVILGTAAYMSPEQAVGGTVDRRADIWSFGVVLWEMLSGRRLFEGETVSHVLAGVLKDTPDLSALPPETPEPIVSLVRRCLRRKARERLQSIGDARLVIDEVIADPKAGERAAAISAVPAAAARPSRGAPLAWIAALVGLAAAALFATLWLRSERGRAVAPGIEAALVAPEGTSVHESFAISPDGRRLVVAAVDTKTGSTSLWLRDLAQGKAVRLEQTDGALMPFWSPDSAQIAFFSKGMLRRVDLTGSLVRDICEAPTPRGGAWGAGGEIVFTASFRTGLSIVPASGGAARVLTTLDPGRHEKSHRFPAFLPGGKSVLFLAQTAEGGTRSDESSIEALDLASGKRTRLITANSSPLYAASGHILFWRGGTLLAQPFDLGRLAVVGEPTPIASPVGYTQNEQALASVSDDGTLVVLEVSRGAVSRLGWLDRKGQSLGPSQEPELISNLVLSHDGKRLALAINGVGQGATDLWLEDVERGGASRLTFEEGGETNAVWSRDDRFVYYLNDRRNDGVIFRRRADGTGAAEEIGTTPAGVMPLAISSDGSWLVVESVVDETGFDLLRFDVATKTATPLVASPFFDRDGQLSPDDRLLAYASEESGRWEVYVQSLDGERGRWQVSSESGRAPHWRADGRELFFLAPPGRMMAVDVEPGAVPRFSAPHELFRVSTEDYDVTPDGQRFIVATFAASATDKPLTLITHWPSRLPKR